MSGNHIPDFGPPDDWADDLADAPHEPSAAERTPNALHIDAESVYDQETQAFIYLLSAAVAKLGGVLVLTKAEREARYAIGIDHSEIGDGSGPLRIFVMEQTP